MSKRLIASIKSNIERLGAKITVTESELAAYKLQREKYVEMLAMLEPQATGEISKEPIDTAVVKNPSALAEEVGTNKQAPFHAKLKHAHGGDAA